MAAAVLFLFLGALIGVAAFLLIEFLLTPFSLYYWFCCRRTKPALLNPNGGCVPDGRRSLPFTCGKKGTVWVLEPEKVPHIFTKETPARGAKDQTNKREIIKVCPVEKHAKIKDCALILSDHDGSHEVFINLLDCIVTTVSASDQSSQKWDKRYPIKLESKSSLIYGGSSICYMYLNTSRDKESWCKALRLASHPDKERINSYAQLSEDFQYYLTFLPFLKPSTIFGEAIEKANKVHRSKKIRGLLKGFVKMTSKNGSGSSSSHEKRKPGNKLLLSNDTSPLDGIVKATSSEKSSSNSLQDQALGSKILLPDVPDAACNEKFVTDEVTLCWNLLFSRLFFDIKRNPKVASFMKEHIQSALSDMRASNHVGRMKCTSLDLGNLPPYIHQMRVLSVDVSAIWAIEIDIEYSGGMTFDIETKYEDQESKLQDGIMDTSNASSGMEMITYVLEDGLEQLKSTGWASTCMPNWKAVQHSVADHISHVTMRIASLRGTLQLHIKPPPSDQLWFGFTSMPEIDWNIDAATGDQKISDGEIALLLKDYFKDAIREFLVVPNFECICIPWMFDEKDDWVPLKAAPFKWVHQGEGRDMEDLEASNPQFVENGNKYVDMDGNKANTSAYQSSSHESLSDFEASQTSPCISTDQLSHANILEMETPQSKETQESSSHSRAASPTIESREMVILEGHKTMHFELDPKPRKHSKKLRMKEMGKMVGDKIEEQRRHIGEKGKYIVEKMRESTRT